MKEFVYKQLVLLRYGMDYSTHWGSFKSKVRYILILRTKPEITFLTLLNKVKKSYSGFKPQCCKFYLVIHNLVIGEVLRCYKTRSIHLILCAILYHSRKHSDRCSRT